MDVKFEQAVFISENKSTIDCVVDEFKHICPKVMCNTLVQMTNQDLISHIIEAGEFVYNNDITPTSLKMIISVIEDAKEYVNRDDFKRCSEAVKELSALLEKARLKCMEG